MKHISKGGHGALPHQNQEANGKMQTSEAAHAAIEPHEEASERRGRSVALLPQPDTLSDGSFGPAEAATSDEARGLLAAIRRLEDIVEEETLALETRQRVDFDEFSLRKSRSMLEFARLTRAPMSLRPEGEVTDHLKRLRLKLEMNRSLLQMHFEATCEVATIIARAIREAESDGTYSADLSREGK